MTAVRKMPRIEIRTQQNELVDADRGDDLRSVLDYYTNEVADDLPLQGLSPCKMFARAVQGNGHRGLRRKRFRINRREDRLNSSIQRLHQARSFLSRSANDLRRDLP